MRTGAAGQREVLLIRRVDDDRPTAGRWALPGGFVGTDSRPGDEWRDGRETRVAACVRELREETHLAVAPDALRVVGVYDAPDRDPRNTAAAQVVSTAFVVDLGAAASGAVVGDDDAAAAGWHEVGAAIDAVAFDHPQIIRDALQLVG
jgi:8-oxo-dGTP diphosphatase